MHWLPIKARIDHKIMSIMHQCTYGTAPDYLKELLHKKTEKRSLRSSSRCSMDYIVPFNIHKTFGDRSFSYYGPIAWNELPLDIKYTQDYAVFKTKCKTFLFQKYFSDLL